MSEADIDLGTLTRAELADRAIADAAFKLEPNKVSEPVRASSEGRGLARHRDRARQDRDLRRGEARAREEAAQGARPGAIFDLHDKIEDQLASGAPLSEVADKLKLNYQVIDQIDREGRKPDGSA